MERLTVNKRTADMNMVELAHNCCYAQNRNAMYRDYDGDYDARELTRVLFKAHTGLELPEEDEEFDWFMSECICEELDAISGVLALLYRNLWAMAELHDRLKHYEDLEEAGRLVILPGGLKTEELFKVIAENACPRWVGLADSKGTSVCDRGGENCLGCWQEALKGEKDG